MNTVMLMRTKGEKDIALLRLLQLVSPSLPIGSYSYSQGIEWAVEAGWIRDAADVESWLSGLLMTNALYLELPLLKRFIDNWAKQDLIALKYWNGYLLASRETAELRLEESNRGRAFYQVLISLDSQAEDYQSLLIGSQMACYSYACQRWKIDFRQAAYGLLWSWLENLVLSAVKIIPLGQSAGQQVIFKLSALISGIVVKAETLSDDDLGASSMALAIASSQHETQYSRLFRS